MELLINADDYGYDETCTRAIIKAFQEDLITTATMMATGEFFDQAACMIKETAYQDRIGIHFVLTEGRPLTAEMSQDPFFCDATGCFHGHFNRYQRLSSMQKKEVYEELCAQIDRIEKSGLKIHHADSHHHIHTAPFITPIVIRVMKDHDISLLRIHRNLGEIKTSKRLMKGICNVLFRLRGIAYSDYFGSYEDLDNVQFKPNDSRVIEVMCHPDIDKNGHLVDRNNEAPYEDPFGVDLKKAFESRIKPNLTNMSK